MTDQPQPQMIFVNLPVSDLAASRHFLEALGATNEPKFSDETAAMMRFSDSVNFMLLTHDKFRMFTDREIIDANRQVQALRRDDVRPLGCLARRSHLRIDVDGSTGGGARRHRHGRGLKP